MSRSNHLCCCLKDKAFLEFHVPDSQLFKYTACSKTNKPKQRLGFTLHVNIINGLNEAYQSINQSINQFISRHSTEARATVRYAAEKCLGEYSRGGISFHFSKVNFYLFDFFNKLFDGYYSNRCMLMQQNHAVQRCTKQL